MMEEEQLGLVEFVIRVDLVILMAPQTQVLVNLVNLVILGTMALVNLEIDAPIADHNLYRSILSDYTFNRSPPFLNKSLKY